MGGAEILISRIAEELVCLKYHVTVVDGEEKIIHKMCPNPNIEKITTSTINPVLVDADMIICFAGNIVNLDLFLTINSNTKILLECSPL